MTKAEARIKKWDLRFLDLARHVSAWSKDPSTKVGVVIADPMFRVVSLGFNGFPRGMADDDRLHDREEKYARIIHGDENAILFANQSLEGCTMYTWPQPPCAHCSALIVQVGISRVITCKHWGARSELYTDIGLETLKEGGVVYAEIDIG